MSPPTSDTKTTPTSDAQTTPGWNAYEAIVKWRAARKEKKEQGAKAAEATQSKLSSGIANA